MVDRGRPAQADSGRCLTHAARSGAIGDSEISYVQVTKTVIEGVILFGAAVSAHYANSVLNDFLSFDVLLDGSADWTSTYIASGVTAFSEGVYFPAAIPEAVAVGAATDFDCRADYSQYGAALDLVAPSSGGSSWLTTTLPYEGIPYRSFSGQTSGACAVASGIAGLMLSRNPALTEPELRQILQDTADKIGLESYPDGRNDYYGYGRVDAYYAVSAVPVPPAISSFGPASGAPGTTVAVAGSGLLGATSVAFNGVDASRGALGCLDLGHRASGCHNRADHRDNTGRKCCER